MRVEPGGALFAEPKVGDSYRKPQQSSEPISILNSKNKESKFIPGEESILVAENHPVVSFVGEEHPLPIGFFLSEEEWSLFKQPHLGLEPYERKKMGSLPTLTPFSLTSRDSVLQQCALSDKSASDLIRFRKCESLSTTPSFFYCNENESNNNNINEPPASTSNKLIAHKSNEFLQEVEEKENWLEKVLKKDLSRRLIETQSNAVNNNNTQVEEQSDAFTWVPVLNDGNNQQQTIFEPSSNPHSGIMPTSAGLNQTNLYSFVETIGSHPYPITSSCRNQNHSSSHNHYPHCHLPDLSLNSPSFSSYPSLNEYHLDWQAQFNENRNDINSNGRDTIVPQPEAPPHLFIANPSSNEFQIIPPILPVKKDEMDTLLTFLSKFDDKVAAIWGNQTVANAFAAASTHDSETSSISSSPITNPYTWGSPSSDQTFSQPGLYDYQYMQMQIESQQQALAESRLAVERFNQRHGAVYPSNIPAEQSFHQFPLPQQFKPCPSNKIAIGTTRISPPKGKYTIMHSMKQHFGNAPSEEDYHIVRKMDVGSSAEEKEKSLRALNHTEEVSGFKRFLPSMQSKSEKQDRVPKLKQTQSQPPQQLKSEIDFIHMQEMLNNLDLECEEESEIVAACKGDPKPFIEAQPQEELLYSWKTHFTTVEFLEASNIHGQPSPSAALTAHQINTNLPEYKLFDGNEQDYGIFKRTGGKSLFPIRFKLRRENEKANQTEEFYFQQHDTLHEYEWEQYLPPNNSYPFSISSSSRTPIDPRMIFDYDSSLEIHPSEWFQDPIGASNGSMLEYDNRCNGGGGGGRSGSMDGGGGNQAYLQTDYCCDSGIDIDASSRSGFYDDVFPDVEGDYEYCGTGIDDAGISIHGYGTTNDNDVDYGQFQGFSFHSGSGSSVAGKSSKGNRRRAKVKPCKYFFLDGSCRRGNNCKFSHDVTTCRYWAEGSCLKGDACPYLHCFLERKELVGHGDFRSSAMRRYHLESENDFPTLGSGSTKAKRSK